MCSRHAFFVKLLRPLIMMIIVALWNREDHYILILLFVLLPSFFLFFHRLISAVAEWMSAILAHMVWPQCEFKMQV